MLLGVVRIGSGRREVTLGFESFEPYPKHSPHLGAIAGRVANRIAGGRFEIGGRTYQLPTNEGRNTLHGGPEGLGTLLWDAETDDAGNAVRFSLVSPDGAMGFPGTAAISAMFLMQDAVSTCSATIIFLLALPT